MILPLPRPKPNTNGIETETLQPNGYKILLELLVRGEITDIIEVPYVFDERISGESNLTLGEYLSFLSHVIKLRGVTQ